MKHYVLSLIVSQGITFEFKSSAINEIYDALIAASEKFGFEVNKDERMDTLVQMKNGQALSISFDDFSIYVGEGEV